MAHLEYMKVKTQQIHRVLFGVCLLSAMTAATSARAQDANDFIYCHRDEGQLREGERVFFTGVFRGDYGWTVGYENDFLDHIESVGVDVGAYSGSYCFFELTRTAAEGALRRDIDEYRSGGYAVVRTEWAPAESTGASQGADSFTSHPLQDFRISIPRSPYDVEVCVRDHECEDGDRVRVSVNGIELMSDEIVNAWMCRSVTLREGRHDIELFAVNGTGYKGEDCSHADANTGEIRVTGEDSQTQSWRHRGGVGSSASIEVTVR